MPTIEITQAQADLLKRGKDVVLSADRVTHVAVNTEYGAICALKGAELHGGRYWSTRRYEVLRSGTVGGSDWLELGECGPGDFYLNTDWVVTEVKV